jgi:DMSO reductase anchor subunit
VPALELGVITAISAGIAALRQIRKTGERGTWATVTGLVFGIIWLAIVVFVYSSKFLAAWL